MSSQEGALRHEAPYWHTFNTNAKQRWYGRRILDVLVEEFRDRTKHYYTWAIHKGLLVVNGEKVTPSYIVQNGDLLAHKAHKHEPPVSSEPVRILHRDDKEGRLVIVKPGSVPVHPAGRYMRHTLLELIKSDFGIPKVHTANRLDRLTSGIMVASTTAESAKKIGAAFEAGRVRKSYVCRVRGEFPAEEITCSAPLLSLDRQTGVVISHPAGRESRTIFNRISYDADTDTSVLFCRPITGRTHQIRVHVQLLGHPVANDPLYDHPIWRAYPATSLAGIAIPSTSQQGEAQSGSTANADAAATKYLCSHPSCATIIESLKNAKDEGEDYSRMKDEIRFAEWNQREGWTDSETVTGVNSGTAQSKDSDTADHALGYCEECFLPLLPDPPVESLFIYLHAIRYETDEWSYEDEMPWWACDDWQQPDAAAVARAKRERGEAVRPPRLKLISESEDMGTSPASSRVQTAGRSSKDSAAIEQAVESLSLLSLSDPESSSRGQHQMLMDFPCPPSLKAGKTMQHSVVLETFRGIEDYTLRDFLVRTNGCADEAINCIKTAVHSSHIIAPPKLASIALSSPLPFVHASYLYVASAALPEELLDQFIADRKILGTVKPSTANRKAKKAAHKRRGGKQGKGQAVDEDAREEGDTGAVGSSAPAPADSSPSVERTPEGSVASEARLLDLITSLWRNNLARVVTAIKAWEQGMIDSGKLSFDAGWTFRTSIDRSAYQFPTLVTCQLEKLVGEVVWETINGNVAATASPPHPVSLTNADLDIVLKFVPSLRGDEAGEFDPMRAQRMIKGRSGSGPANLSQCWENNPPGSLLLMIKLNDKGGEGTLQHRPTIDHTLTDGGTSFARFRAYSLASMLPVPAPGPPTTASPLRIWEPCVGTGSIVIELAAALRERRLQADVFGSDIEADDVAMARRISEMSHWPEDTKQDGVTVHYKHMDLRDEKATAEWIGRESLDAIVTDLPWGRRVLSHGALQTLYVDFINACLRTLRPHAYALVLTLEHRTLARALLQAEGLMRRRGGKWKMELEPLKLSTEGVPDIVARVNKQGHRQADEAEGIRLVEMGLRPNVCLLRKTPL